MAIAAWPNETEISELCKALKVSIPKIEFVERGRYGTPFVYALGTCTLERSGIERFTEQELQFGIAQALAFGSAMSWAALAVFLPMISGFTWALGWLYRPALKLHEPWAMYTLGGLFLGIPILVGLLMSAIQRFIIARTDRKALEVTGDLPAAISCLEKIRLSRMPSVPGLFRAAEGRYFNRRIEDLRKAT